MSCSSDEQSDKECPLCMEVLEFDDLDFYPCKCEYQICRFCWHRIRTDENGLCPACRQPYPEDPVNFKPLSTADLKKIRSEKKMKAQAERQRVSESRKHLSNFRVLQKNLVYVVGLSPRVADSDALKKPEYFGRFGKILKVVVGTTTTVPPNMNPSHTAYVTYSKVEEALKAIQSVNNAALDGRLVRASLGTTKYCSSFLRSQSCYKQECMYLHDIADSDISFTKEDMHQGKHAEYERRLMEQVLRTYQTPVATVTPTVRLINNIGTISSASGDRIAQSHLKKESGSDKESDEPKSREEFTENRDIEETNGSHDDNTEIENGNELSEKEENTLTRLQNEDVAAQSHVEQMDPRSPIETKTKSDGDLLQLQPTSRLHSWTKGFVPNEVNNVGSSAISWQSLLGLDHSDTPLSSLQDPIISQPLFPVPSKASTLPPPGIDVVPHHASSVSKPTSPPPGLGGFSDDDLGFDPFRESAKGLADLMEEEKRNQSHAVNTNYYQPAYTNGFGNYPQSSTAQATQNLYQENIVRQNLFSSLQYQRERQELEQAQRDQWLRSMQNYSQPQPQSQLQPQSQPQQRSGFFMSRFGGGTNAFNSNPKPVAQPHMNAFDIFSNRMEPAASGVAPPPGLAPSRQNSYSSQSHQPFQQYNGGLLATNSSSKGPLLNEWQEGLKALLPNVNIRFAADTDQNRWPHPANQPLLSLANHASTMPAPMIGNDQRRVHAQHIPPPPGFGNRSGER